MNNIEKLVYELCKAETETQWVEFKTNNYSPEMIGKSIAALANGATLYDKNEAYMVWGVEDTTHKIVGTSFDLQTLKKGNQELENWLRSLLSANVNFEFYKVDIESKTVGVLIITKAQGYPVMFEKTEYIRVGSYTKKLNDHPNIKQKLWEKLRNTDFEQGLAKQELSLSEALDIIDYPAYFELLQMSIPTDAHSIEYYLLQDSLLIKQPNGMYAVTNLGAILFAKRINDFETVSRKAVRLVQYQGLNRLNMLREFTVAKGYAAGFENIISYLQAILPTEEKIDGALRTRENVYPNLAVREIVANALIHQDFSVRGTGPVIEIFNNRIEITNPGRPIVDITRIIDTPPKSRNEKTAAMMRRLRMCEELGTGWDKITISCEMGLLPTPRIELYEETTRVTLFSHKQFSALSIEDKLWNCYTHACIKHIQGDYLTNSSLRTRFALPETASGTVSRLIKDAVEKNIIKPIDPHTAPRYMKYIPAWA